MQVLKIYEGPRPKIVWDRETQRDAPAAFKERKRANFDWLPTNAAAAVTRCSYGWLAVWTTLYGM